jgi:peptidoglycan/xylan/chitin deacetylase (PgdA/CDA1 family)
MKCRLTTLFTLVGLSVAMALPGGLGRGLAVDDAVDPATAVPILVYHRFAETAADRMTTPTAVFEAQLQYLIDHSYTVIPLRQLVDYLRGQGPAPPPRAVVITADDGHRSVYTELLPRARKHRLPVTLFIYPSAISNASYALTWVQLRELRDSGLFDIQSHTYWHPNFRTERQRLTAADYAELVAMQLGKSREKLRQEVGGAIDLLAWPFGLHDPWLREQARKAGYLAAFTIEPRPATTADAPLALPRFLLTDATGVKGLARLLAATPQRRP